MQFNPVYSPSFFRVRSLTDEKYSCKILIHSKVGQLRHLNYFQINKNLQHSDHSASKWMFPPKIYHKISGSYQSKALLAKKEIIIPGIAKAMAK